MYCILRYLDYLSHESHHEESNITLKKAQTEVEPLNATMYFNPNCILQLILDYIFAEAQITIDGENNDLCTVSGELLGIKDFKPTISGLAIFKPRASYYVVMLKRNDTKSQIDDIIPILHPSSETYVNLMRCFKDKKNLKKKSSIMKRSNSSRQSMSKHSMTLSHSSNTSNPNSKGRRISSANI